jgi:hypothetical protein
MGDSILLWTITGKLQKYPIFLATLFHGLGKFQHKFWQKWFGLHFGWFFHKLIWSPWSPRSLLNSIWCFSFLATDELFEFGPGLPDGLVYLGKFWSVLVWKMLIYFMALCNILWTFGIFYDHLVYFVFIWYIFFGFGIMYQEKSGNPDSGTV